MNHFGSRNVPCTVRSLPFAHRKDLMTRLVRGTLLLLVAAGLAVDAWVHLDVAPAYDGVRTSAVSQGDLFRAESVAAILSAVLLLAWPRRWTAAVALLVAAGGVAAVLLYQYVDVGALGPLPDMYEPVWFTRKLQSLWAEAAAAVAAAVLLALPSTTSLHRKDHHASHVDHDAHPARHEPARGRNDARGLRR